MNDQPPTVKNKFCGTSQVELTSFRETLGLTTFETWVAYLWRRNEDAVSFASARQIAKDKGMPSASVQRACAKLAKLGLLVDAVWAKEPKGTRFKRTVLGDFREGKISVPRGTLHALERLPKRGGTRKGAGRKKSPKNGERMCSLNQVDSPKTGERMCSLNQVDSPKTPQNDVQTKVNQVDSPYRQEASKVNQVDSTLKSINLFLKEKMQAPDVPEIINLHNNSEELPPYPSANLLSVAKIPRPKLLHENLSDRECVEFMISVYRGAVVSRFKKPCYAFTRGDISKSKYYRGFVSAAGVLKDFEVAPASWAAFSVDAWCDYMTSSKPPGANWVYSAKRLQEKQEWFENELVSYGGGRLLFSAAHTDAIKRYTGLRQQTAQLELTEALIEKWFPGGWQKHYEKATIQNQQDQKKLNELAERGEFIW